MSAISGFQRDSANLIESGKVAVQFGKGHFPSQTFSPHTVCKILLD